MKNDIKTIGLLNSDFFFQNTVDPDQLLFLKLSDQYPHHFPLYNCNPEGKQDIL